MAETIVLDPTEVAVSRTQVDITPWVKGDGIDWGDAEIAAYMADQARGASPVDFRVPNRTVTIPLVLKGVGGTSFATARTTVQAKAALFQREGGWLKRLTSSGSMVFADVVSATLKLGGGWTQAHRSADLDAQLTLDVLPDFYGAEVTLPDHATTTATELVFTETGILGDYPGRCRIVVDEDDGDRQLGLLWGLRSRNYDSAATARLAYNAGTLTTQDAATVAGTTIEHATVPSMWTPILKTDIIPSGALTHVGTYRVWAQVRSVGVTERGVDVRLVWDVGDLSTPVISSTKRIPGADFIYALDLGEVRLDRTKSGTHRWQGQIQAKATTAPADVIVSKVWFVPVDDGYGVLRAPLNSAASFNVFTVRDEFNQTSGALHGKTVQVGGGTWSTFANGASPTDFSATGTPNFWINRNATAEQWRGAVAGSASLTDVVAQMDFHWSVIDLTDDDELALFARRIDQNNFIAIDVVPATGNVVLRRYSSFSGAGGSYTILDSATVSLAAGTWYTLRLYVDTTGLVAGWVGPRGSSFGDPLLVGRTADAATGGALATGTTGLFEGYGSAVSSVRTYDNFLAYPPAIDAVLHPSQSAELRTEGLYREDATGTSYAPVPFPTYDNPRLPPAGLEGRTCEVFIKDSRGDFDLLPDSATDDISARIFYRPCWLFVP